MRERNWYYVLAVLVLGALFVALVPTNVMSADNKPDTYYIYNSHDVSGPMGAINAAVLPCAEDFTHWFNGTGGINGVPIKIITRDNVNKVDAGIAAYEYFRQQKPKPSVVSISSTGIAFALKDRCAEDKIVNMLCGSSNKAIYPVGWIVGTTVSYTSACAATFEWIRKNWKGGKIKVGFLTWDNPYGKGIFDPKLEKWFAEQPGMELVGKEVFKGRDVDVATQIMRLKHKGANWIYDNTVAVGPAVVSKSLKAMGCSARTLVTLLLVKSIEPLALGGLIVACSD